MYVMTDRGRPVCSRAERKPVSGSRGGFAFPAAGVEPAEAVGADPEEAVEVEDRVGGCEGTAGAGVDGDAAGGGVLVGSDAILSDDSEGRCK